MTFRSETDSEVLAHLIAGDARGHAWKTAVRAALRLVTGTYGFAVLDAQRPESIVVARNGSPVILGIGEQRDVRRLGCGRARAPHAERRASG